MTEPTSLDDYRARRQPQLPDRMVTLYEIPEGGVCLSVGPVGVALSDDQVQIVSAFLLTYLARVGGAL